MNSLGSCIHSIITLFLPFAHVHLFIPSLAHEHFLHTCISLSLHLHTSTFYHNLHTCTSYYHRTYHTLPTHVHIFTYASLFFITFSNSCLHIAYMHFLHLHPTCIIRDFFKGSLLGFTINVIGTTQPLKRNFPQYP